MSDAALLARLALMEAKLEDMSRELAQLGASRRASMAQQQRCPACRGSLFFFAHVYERNGRALVPFSLHKKDTFWAASDRAPLEAFVCRTCGLVEWHARELEVIEPNVDALVIDVPAELPTPSDGPFR